MHVSTRSLSTGSEISCFKFLEISKNPQLNQETDEGLIINKEIIWTFKYRN